MNMWDMIGITPALGLRMAVGAAGILLLIGLRFWWRSRTEERVRVHLND